MVNNSLIQCQSDVSYAEQVLHTYQILDKNGRVIHIDWSRVFAPAESVFTVYHNCDVLESGKYVVEIFILNNLENPVPYSTKFSEIIVV